MEAAWTSDILPQKYTLENILCILEHLGNIGEAILDNSFKIFVYFVLRRKTVHGILAC